MAAKKKEASSLKEEGKRVDTTKDKKKSASKKKKAKIPVRNLTVRKKTTPAPFEIPEAKESEVEMKLDEIRAQDKKQTSPSFTKDAIDKVIKKNSVKTKSPSIYRKIALVFIILTAGLLAIVFYVSYAKVTIVLAPKSEQLSDSINFSVYDADKNPSLENNNTLLPGVVEEVVASTTKTYNASGMEKIGEEVIGQVTLINNYTKNQPLVATTRLLSADGKLFRLKKTVSVPAGGKIEAEVYADKPSASMAISPTHFTIPGLWAGIQDKIYAESKIPFVYKEQTKKLIAQTDIDNAMADLKTALLQQVGQKYASSYGDYSGVIYEIEDGSIATKINGKVGDEQPTFNAEIRAKVAVVAFSKEKIEQIAEEKMSIMVPDNKELVNFDNSNLVYTLKDFNLSSGQANLTVVFSGKMTLRKDAEILDRNKILGLSADQLNSYLQSFNEFSSYEIRFTPSFIHSVPWLADRIEISVK